jgi:aspartate/methionine/tyrosine aminotransferase
MLYEISEKTMRLESEGKKITKFNLGDPDQPTPNEIIEAAFEAMKLNQMTLTNVPVFVQQRL